MKIFFKPEINTRRSGYLLLLLFSVLLMKNAAAQNDCSQRLKQAQKAYDHGLLSSIEDSLGNCLTHDGFTKTEKIQAYKLLVLTNLFEDQPEKAEQYLLNLLKEDPEYKVNEAVDPAEFTELFNCYRTRPIFSLGFAAGVNTSVIRNKDSFGVYNLDSTQEKYDKGFGFQAGAIGDVLLFNNFMLNAGVFFEAKKYTYKNTLFGYSNLQMIETQRWLEVPVSIKYQFGKRKFSPYLLAGISGQLLLSSSGDFSRKNKTTGENEAIGPAISLKTQRKHINSAMQFGTGFRYKLGYGYLFLDARYTAGIRFVNENNTKYQNFDIVYKYGYIDNNFFLDNILVSVGYMKNFYKPKKIKSINE